jgi:hypothetical protein
MTTIDREQLRAWLKAEGLAAGLPPAAQKVAQHWREMPEAKKEKHIRFMRDLHLDPPLSQIIIENR